MNNEIRLSLSAAREDDGQPLHIATEGSLNQLPTKRRKGWTPAPTKPAYSQTNVSLAHKGRDYDAILRAAKRKPVGYWEDAPSGIKFGKQNTGVGSGSCPTTDATASKQGVAPLASTLSTTPPPQQSADSPWPKCLMHHDGGYEFLDVYALDAGGLQYHKNDPHAYRCGEPYSTRTGKETVEAVSQAEAAQWLEQNGHEDAAAQLRGKAADDGLYEPVGTMPVAGDVVRWGEDLIKITRIDSALQFSVRFNRAGGQEDGLFMSYFSDRRHAPLRILKRKPTVQREPLHA